MKQSLNIGRIATLTVANIVESLNSWLMSAREQPLLPMIETIRQELMDWFEQRRKDAALWPRNDFVPKVTGSCEMKLTVDYKGSYIVDDKSSTVSVHARFRINI